MGAALWAAPACKRANLSHFLTLKRISSNPWHSGAPGGMHDTSDGRQGLTSTQPPKSVHVKQVFRWGSAGVPRGFRWGSSGVPRVHRGFRCVFACVRPTFQGVPSEGTAGFYNIKKEQTGSWGQGVYERAALF